MVCAYLGGKRWQPPRKHQPGDGAAKAGVQGRGEQGRAGEGKAGQGRAGEGRGGQGEPAAGSRTECWTPRCFFSRGRRYLAYHGVSTHCRRSRSLCSAWALPVSCLGATSLGRSWWWVLPLCPWNTEQPCQAFGEGAGPWAAWDSSQAAGINSCLL